MAKCKALMGSAVKGLKILMVVVSLLKVCHAQLDMIPNKIYTNRPMHASVQ